VVSAAHIDNLATICYKMQVKIFFVILSLFSGIAQGRTSKLLDAVEQKYKDAPSVAMDVSKSLKLKLLEKEKKSSGAIILGKGGRFRWETTEPDHSLVLADGKNLWLVDYPQEEEEKPNIIKAANPKHSQPHAVVAFLLSEGRISDDFSVNKEEDMKEDRESLSLRPKDKTSQIRWLKLLVNKDEKTIENISFEDIAGNTTDLSFKNIRFDQKLDATKFKFHAPKGADVTVIN
jgi:outer membrane lipoprotein carrier protein